MPPCCLKNYYCYELETLPEGNPIAFYWRQKIFDWRQQFFADVIIERGGPVKCSDSNRMQF